MSSLLAGIRFGAASDSDEGSRKDKKKKKESKKKDSKSSSGHKKKHKDNGANDATGVPATYPSIPAVPPSLPRDEWMNMDFVSGPPRPKQLTPEESRAAALETKKQDEINRGLREPQSGLLYGLYDPKNGSAPVETAMAAPVAMPSVGDGGASWKRKMLQRAKQKAADTGEPLESVVRGQYGMSLAELEAQAAVGSCADNDSHLRYKRITPQRRPEDKHSGKTCISRGGDKNIISGFATRMKYTNLSTETFPGDDSREKRSHDDDEDSGPIDYSKLPDGEDRGDRRSDKRPRHHSRRDMSPSQRRRSRSRSSDRRSSDHRQDDLKRPPRNGAPRQDKTFVKPAMPQVTAAQQEEAARRKAFLYHQSAGLLSSTAATTQSASNFSTEPASAPRVLAPGAPPSDEPVDLNKLAAQALRAKMRGNMVLFESLTKQVNEAEHQLATIASASTAPPTARKRQAPIKPPRAMVRPRETVELPLRPEDNLTGSKQGKRKQPGEDMSLDEMVRQEKTGEGDSHMDAVYARNIVRLGARYEGTELSAGKKGAASGFDEDETGDLALNLHQSAASRLTEKALVVASDRAALSDRMQWDKAMQKCRYCLKSDGFKAHLVVSMAPNAYLALPAASTIVDLQCIIVPVEHIASMSAADEAVDADVRQFKAALVSMAASQHMSMLFLERTFDAGRKKHTVIECVPVPTDVGMDAPMFFKQAMLECDEEWSTHKKILDSTGKGIKRTVPSNFAYFHVEWAGQNEATGGYAHIIEDTAQFPVDFGLDTIAGMLDVDPPRYGRYHPSLAAESGRVKSFQAVWQPYDWTQTAA
ncbi:hypothetical protein H310_07517 [Aphanomyces invadans]|uniref:Cwf19-like C-terminal domain-containing protein n=1 Tax=Aphanomyces invadans TaxID=157072 RepID=A0A024U2G0_9STRA|nr:hypothetical protein H310_07517 [Aphanomyces invadans]ETW00092.1 hypothetical protein H310_07517 [Aphanomyces invadans]|eukprot:XP_008871117.1 hypothetical protein H310_07517 [Aphanomyces invadans]